MFHQTPPAIGYVKRRISRLARLSNASIKGATSVSLCVTVCPTVENQYFCQDEVYVARVAVHIVAWLIAAVLRRVLEILEEPRGAYPLFREIHHGPGLDPKITNVRCREREG